LKAALKYSSVEALGSRTMQFSEKASKWINSLSFQLPWFLFY
jgi:hypothetical protein